MSLRVLLINGHKMMREALRALLESGTGIVVVAEADDGNEALERLPTDTAFDIVLMVVNIAGRGSATNTVEQLIHNKPGVKVVVISAYPDKAFILGLLEAGAKACLVKADESEDLFRALSSASQNQIYLSPTVSACVGEASRGKDPSGRSRLAPRERQVLTLLAEGLHAAAIGQRLSIAPSTVEVHRRNIMRKAGVRGIAELTKYAIREGMASV